MTKKEQQTYLGAGIAAIIAAVLIGAWMLAKNSGNQNSASTTPPDKQQAATSTSLSNQTTWEGVLKASDNLQKGNLMLQTSDRTIYLKTSRDFSALIGKYVAVIYLGTLNNFTLLNIFEMKGE